MLSTSRSFFEIPLDILFAVIAFNPDLGGLFRGLFGGGGVEGQITPVSNTC